MARPKKYEHLVQTRVNKKTMDKIQKEVKRRKKKVSIIAREVLADWANSPSS